MQIFEMVAEISEKVLKVFLMKSLVFVVSLIGLWCFAQTSFFFFFLISLTSIVNVFYHRYNEGIVKQILLKTMMMAPRSDYALAKYLIDSNRVTSPVCFFGSL